MKKPQALVVGINDYLTLDPLGTPANDANAVAQKLMEFGFEVTGLPATSSQEASLVDTEKHLLTHQLDDAITNLFALNANVSIPETALLFFAGHGLRKATGSLAEGFLATSRVDSQESWGFSLQRLRRILEKSPVKQQIVILDCCHAGELLNFDEADPGDRETISHCLIAACREFEPAYEPTIGKHSFFTEALLQALQQDGIISSITICQYIETAFKTRNQQPICHKRGEIILREPELLLPEDPPDDCPNPYKGLEAFQEADAPYFFGREKLTETLVYRLRESPFLGVLGISGSGKSSVVRAGLIPDLKKGNTRSETATWKIYEPFKPGDDPIASLAQVLVDENLSLEEVNAKLAQGYTGLQRLISQTKRPCVLVVDQFEQLFTPYLSEDKRRQFLDCLCGEGQGNALSLRVVITMRADFLGKCAEYPQLAKLITANQEIVTEMEEEELRAAISKPAQKVNWRISPDLEDRMVADVQKAPGSLPLLQHVLKQLWERRGQGLTAKTYRDMGGVQQALQEYAEGVYKKSLTPEEQTIAKDIFLQLTQLVGTEPTSRQVRKTRLTDLPPSPEKVETVLGKLEEAWLVVTSELQARGDNSDKIIVVEVTHEALISNWDTLKQWVGENPDIKRQRDELQKKAQEWEDKGKRREGLLRGLDLGEAEAFVRRNDETGIALEYVRKSIRERRTTSIISISAVVAVFTVVTGLWLNAQRQATIANLRAKAAEAENLLSSADPVGGLVLAIQATGESQDKLRQVLSPVEGSLLDSIQTTPEQNRLRHQGWVTAVAISPDGQTIVSGSDDNTVRLWNRQGEPIGEPFRGHQSWVRAVAISPDGQTIVSGSSDNTVRLWNRQGELISELRGHQDSVRAVAISADGQTIVSGSDDNTVRLWNRQGELIRELRGHQYDVNAVAISADGQTIVSGSEDETVRLWNRQGELIRELRGHQYGVNAVAISPDGQTIVSGGGDSVHLWNRQGGQIGLLRGHQGLVFAVAISADGQTIVSGSRDKTVRLWNRQGEQIGELRGHQGLVFAVAISPDGETIVSGSADKTVRLWNRQGELIGQLRGHQNLVNAVAISPDGQTIVSGSWGGTVHLWNRQGELIRELRGHQDLVWAVAISPDGQTIVSGSQDNTVRLWNRQGEQLGILRGHRLPVRAVAISPDGQTIVSGSEDNTVRLWNRQGELIRELRGHQDDVNAVAISPDGQTIVSGSGESFIPNLSYENTVRLWNRQGEEIGVLRGHQDDVNAVAFSADGQTIVSGSRDNTLRLWNRQGELIRELRGHQDDVNAVAISPDGQTIVSGSDDNTVRLWPMDWKKGLQMACHQLQYHPVLVASETDVAREAGETCQKYVWNHTESAQFLVRQGNALARNGDFSGAVAQFKRALKLDDSLDLNPEAKAKPLAVPALIAQGEQLAREARVEEAIAKFQQALKLDDSLDLDPEAKAKQIATSTLVKQGEELAGEGQIDEAIAKFQQALTVDETLDLDPEAKATKIGVPVLVAQGKKLAGEGKVDEAIAKFQAALKWDKTLELDPKSEAIQIATSALVKQGEQLAGEGQIDEAITKFQQALKLDNTLDLDPEAKAKQIAAAAVVEKAKQFTKERKYKEAIEAYTAAQKIDSRVKIPAQTWNEICWYGSLGGEAAAVIEACKKAVNLAPKYAGYRANLGIAKAMTGDKEGAIQDFQAYIELSNDEGGKEIVQGYIDALSAGENPFTEAEIKRLLGE